MVSPTSATLSPTGKTPLATYFEETNPASGLVSPSGAAAAAAAGAASGLGPVGAGLTAATADDAAASLAGLQLGAVGSAAVGSAGAAGGAPRPYSPLEGAGLPLFGDASLLVPSSQAANSNNNSSGVPAGIVGVQ